MKAVAVGCLRSFKDGSMDLEGCPQNVKDTLSAKVDMMIDTISMFCSGQLFIYFIYLKHYFLRVTLLVAN